MRKCCLLLLVFTIQFSSAQLRFQDTPNGHNLERTFSETLVSDVAYQGYDEARAYYGQGEFEVFLDTEDAVLDKPVIVLDGFDPGDSRSISDIYANLSYGGENLADILRNEGFDIVVLNAPTYVTDGKFIDGGADYIQRNALVLKTLIQQLNADKIGENDLVVLGPSMGGLIGRYALAYMEQNNLDPETRLYISFDAPHGGANIPIGIQYLLNYLVETLGDPTGEQVINELLDSPAAKEMLIDHLYGHLASNSTYEQDPSKLLPSGAPNFRDEFQAELDALGFPTNVRKVALINGDGNGMTTGSPGMSIIDTRLELDVSSSLDIAINFTPEASQTINVTDLTLHFFNIPIETFQAVSQSPASSDGVDSAPGGTGSIADALGDGGGNPFLIDFIAALQQDEYSFIPTMSALAIDNPDWFATPNLDDSPFDAVYIPQENQPHMTMTAGSIQFVLDEIRNNTMTVYENPIDTSFLLAPNPIGSTINVLVPKTSPWEVLTTGVYDLTGKKLMEQTWVYPQKELVMAHNLDSGIYLLTLENGTSVQTLKLLVE